MSNTSEDQEKVEAYLDVIQDRILGPIQNTEIQKYCTATLLLLFAAIDGLGKLLHPNDHAKMKDRIFRFLEYMGDDYEVNKERLHALRNSLAHNAINVESFLSHTEINSNQHLRRISNAGFIYVNTTIMYHDFLNTFELFRAEIQQDPVMMERAAKRLKWIEDNPLNDPNSPTPPPPVEFIYIN
jgi:hypothetical protein